MEKYRSFFIVGMVVLAAIVVYVLSIGLAALRDAHASGWCTRTANHYFVSCPVNQPPPRHYGYGGYSGGGYGHQVFVPQYRGTVVVPGPTFVVPRGQLFVPRDGGSPIFVPAW